MKGCVRANHLNPLKTASTKLVYSFSVTIYVSDPCVLIPPTLSLSLSNQPWITEKKFCFRNFVLILILCPTYSKLKTKLLREANHKLVAHSLSLASSHLQLGEMPENVTQPSVPSPTPASCLFWDSANNLFESQLCSPWLLLFPICKNCLRKLYKLFCFIFSTLEAFCPDLFKINKYPQVS